MTCPSCGSDDIRRSRRRLLLFRGWRCRTCRRRFLLGGGAAFSLPRRHAAPPKRELHNPRRRHSFRTRYERWRMRRGSRLARRIVVTVCVLVSVLAFFYVLTYGLVLMS